MSGLVLLATRFLVALLVPFHATCGRADRSLNKTGTALTETEQIGLHRVSGQVHSQDTLTAQHEMQCLRVRGNTSLNVTAAMLVRAM